MSITLIMVMVLFLFLLFFGVPIGLVMGMCSLFYFLTSGNPFFIKMLPERMFGGIDQFVLMAIPFFMFAGELMNRIGISDKLVKFANLLIGKVRGGLAQVNILSSIIFAGITGVALGDIAAIGTIFIPAMEKQGYDRKFSAAVTAASSIIGPIIPPSINIVFYCAIMRVSVGKMFLAAIIPGIIIGLSDMIIVYFLAKKRNYPKVEVKTNPKEFVQSLKGALYAIVSPLIIIGGIVFGMFTPTEAAAVAILYSIIIGFFVFRTLKIKDLIMSAKYAVYGSAKIFFIITGGYALAWVFGMENIASVVEKLILNISENKIILILLINAIFLIAGMFGETDVAIILLAPILAPIVLKFGIGEIQFGIMLIVNVIIGLLTPPVGTILYVVADMARVPSMELAIELLPFIAVNYIGVLMIAFFPFLTEWLPALVGL